jgi:MFS family permease
MKERNRSFNKAKIPLSVIMLGVVSLFTDVASEMIYPLVPVFITALGSGAIMIGIIEGLAETTSSILKLITGVLSDKTGRRKIFVVTGYAISSAIRPLTGIVNHSWEIVFVRMFDRVGKGIRTSPRDALIASSVDESIRGRSFGFERAMDHIGAVAGPLLAIITLVILIVGFGFSDPVAALRWTFILAIIPGILAVLTLVFFVKESSQSKKATSLSLTFKNVDSNFRNYLLTVILFTLGNSSDAFLLYRTEEAIQRSGAVINLVRNIGPLQKTISGFGDKAQQATLINILFLPLVWAFFHVIKAALSTPLGTLSDRIGRKRVINTGWIIYAVVYISFALLIFLPEKFQVIATFVLFAVYALFYAFTEGAEKAFVADLVPGSERGTAFGLFNFAVGSAALPASLIFGFLYSFSESRFPGFGGTVAFGFGGLMAILAIISLKAAVDEPASKKL